MKTCILSPAADNWIDPPVAKILQYIPSENRADPANADVVIVPITFKRDFVFDPQLPSMLDGKKWALVCFTENGWNDPQESSWLWGSERMNHHDFAGHEQYALFDKLVRENPPVLTFQRELLEKDRTETLIPCEYTCHLPEFGCDTKDEFNRRVLEVANVWGRSSEYRMYMHAAIFKSAPTYGYDVISEFAHVDRAVAENPEVRKWLSVHVPHYARIDVTEVQSFIRKSKLGLNLSGCGFKNFRTGEICGDCVMAMPKNDLAWSYRWNEMNSIVLPKVDFHTAHQSIGVMDEALNDESLYDIYLAAMENARNYRADTYARRWILGNIERVLS